MKPAILALALAVALAVAGAIASLPACPTEDSASCNWNAAERGNGKGRSFTNLGDVVVIYWSR